MKPAGDDVTTRPIYMDHNATTPALPEVVSAILPYFTEEFGNPSSATHAYGRKAAEAVAAAREAVARLLGADRPEEVIFTAGATESDNLALLGVCRRLRGRANHVVTCATEHEAVLETCMALAEEGFETTVLPVGSDGRLDPDRVREAVARRTAIVSVMMANNEIGTIQPLSAIADICHEAGALLHTDAVQAFGRIPVDVARLGVDLVSVTAHKMYGPKGIGALWMRRGVELAPMLHGGGQEGKLRSGTLNVPAIVGFGAAAVAAARDMQSEGARQEALRDRLWSKIATVPDVTLNGSLEHRLPNNLNVAFEGIDGEALVTLLRDVAALSTGSACASGQGKGSYVVRALSEGPAGEARARSSVRFGLGRSNDEEQVDRVARHIAEAVSRLRAMAPAMHGSTDNTSREEVH